jgi:hypothetical protein
MDDFRWLSHQKGGHTMTTSEIQKPERHKKRDRRQTPIDGKERKSKTFRRLSTSFGGKTAVTCLEGLFTLKI